MESSYVLKDISEYEERIFFGLTIRQTIWGAIAIVSGVGIYCLTSLVLHIPDDICIYGTIAISFCLFWMGWRKWQGTRPYSEKIKVILKFYSTKQRVVYSNSKYWFDKIDIYMNLKGENLFYVWKKKRENKKINKKYCTEYTNEN